MPLLVQIVHRAWWKYQEPRKPGTCKLSAHLSFVLNITTENWSLGSSGPEDRKWENSAANNPYRYCKIELENSLNLG
jgi:hypothetical protein